MSGNILESDRALRRLAEMLYCVMATSRTRRATAKPHICAAPKQSHVRGGIAELSGARPAPAGHPEGPREHLPADQLRQVAVLAGADPRSVARVMAGHRVRRLVHARVVAALRALGLA